jgi:hypothetical protein
MRYLCALKPLSLGAISRWTGELRVQRLRQLRLQSRPGQGWAGQHRAARYRKSDRIIYVENKPILIFGWILQFGYGMIPYLLVRGFQPRRPGRLGGTWFNLIPVSAGGALYLISLFLATDPGALRGVAYIFWIISLIPILLELRGIVRAGSGRIEETALEELVVAE